MDSNLDIKPGEIMKMYRVRKGYSQERLALLINGKEPKESLYQMKISRYESGYEVPEDDVKEIIDTLLGCKIWTKEEVE